MYELKCVLTPHCLLLDHMTHRNRGRILFMYCNRGGRVPPSISDLISNYFLSPLFHSKYTGLHAAPQHAKETHASRPLLVHLLFPLPLPQISALRSPCSHWFLFKCPLPSETSLDHILKLLVQYHSIFYLPAVLSFFPIAHITSTTPMLLILLTASSLHQNASSQR